MFEVMNKKRRRRWAIIGIMGFLIFFFYEFFGAVFLAERRYLSDKKQTIENFKAHENVFEEIRIRSLNFPDFYLGLDSSLNEIISFEDRRLEQSDTTIYFKNWSIIFNKVGINTDSIFPKNLLSIKENISQFDTLYTLLKDTSCKNISKAKGHLKMVFISGGFDNAGFRYISFHDHLKEKEYTFDDSFIRRNLNNHFYWEYYDESLIGQLYPIWRIPKSEFKNTNQ